MDCGVENTMCSSSKCKCKTGYVEIDGECITGNTQFYYYNSGFLEYFNRFPYIFKRYLKI